MEPRFRNEFRRSSSRDGTRSCGRALRPRSIVEPLIGHPQNSGLPDGNWIAGLRLGAITVISDVADINARQIVSRFRRYLL